MFPKGEALENSTGAEDTVADAQLARFRQRENRSRGDRLRDTGSSKQALHSYREAAMAIGQPISPSEQDSPAPSISE
jgi:hypothetical protein